MNDFNKSHGMWKSFSRNREIASKSTNRNQTFSNVVKIFYCDESIFL